MRTRVIQNNFTGGELSPTLGGRIDIEKYYKSCSKAENVIIMPHGGLKRRGGLKKITSGYINKYCRLESFQFSVTQVFLIVMATDLIHIFKNGTQVATVTSPYTTQAMLDEVDVAQSADVMLMVHEDVPPKRLVRGSTDSSWTISDIPLTNIPQYTFNTTPENVWSSTRGYPRTITFHGGRLWFGGSKSKISSVWGSVSNDFFNFKEGTGLADELIFDTLDTDQFNKIQGIFSGRSLQIFTSGGEFYNNAKLITPSDSSWLMQTNYGTKRLRPVSVDGSTLYVNRNGRSLRQFTYNFNEDAYNSINTSLLNEHLITDIRAVDVQRSTLESISDYVYIIDESGICLVLNTMRNEDILGWTHWTTQGNFIDVAVVGNSTYFLVLRDGSYYIEELNNDHYMDHSTIKTGTNFTTVETTEAGSVLTKEHRVVTDGSVQPDKTPNGSGVITLNRPANVCEVGLGYDVEVTTMPINFQDKDGMVVNHQKRVLETILRVYNTVGAIAQGELMRGKKFPILLNSSVDPYTGELRVTHLGFSRLNSVTVTQTDPLPFHLLQIESITEV